MHLEIATLSHYLYIREDSCIELKLNCVSQRRAENSVSLRPLKFEYPKVDEFLFDSNL